MSDPDYMDHIENVARSNVSPPPMDAEARVVEIWGRYEKLAATLGYDILSSGHSFASALRKIGRELIAACYEAQPKSSVAEDVAQLREKNRQYGGSWCARGGQGAFFTVCRKTDRLVSIRAIRADHDERAAKGERFAYNPGDVDTEDTIGDLRRYMILIEAWHQAREAPLKIDEQKFLENDRRVPRQTT